MLIIKNHTKFPRYLVKNEKQTKIRKKQTARDMTK